MKIMVYAILAAIVVLSVAVGIQFGQIQSSRAEARARNTATWHQVLCVFESATIASKDTPYEKKVATVKFFDDLLVHIGSTPCGLKVPKEAK